MHAPHGPSFDRPLHRPPGFGAERRRFLGTVATACAAAAVPGAARCWQDPRHAAADPWTIERFLQEVTPLCRELLRDRSARGQDRYLAVLAGHAVMLADVPRPTMREVGDGHRIGSNHGPEPFTVLHWTLEPGAVITPHAHAYGNVVTLGLTGSAVVTNYEVVGARDYDAEAPFEVERVQEQLLRAGDVNLVSLERHYVHGFVAGPDGASGLDITTRIAPKRRTPVLELGEAIDTAGRRHRARWRFAD